MEITYYGHSCFGIETNDVHLLFDPFIRPNELAKKVDFKNIKADFIFISHAHEDHVADAMDLAKLCNACIVSNYEIVMHYASKGIENGHPMNLGGAWNFDFGSVRSVQAVHSSGFADGTYGGNPGGFILELEGKSIYYAGDTALHYDMKMIAERWKPDLAFLPIGDNFTMGIEDANMAASYINCDQIIGMHYDTFPYIVIDHQKAKDTFAASGKNLTLMDIGSTNKF